jgi:hypothetical protein
VNRTIHNAVFRRPAVRLTALLALVVQAPAIAQEAAISEVAVDPPGRVARLSYLEGSVSLASGGVEEWTEAVLNRPLTSGDRLWLDEGARAELEVGSTTLHLDYETAFGFVKLDDSVLLASLADGVASIRVRSLDDQEAIQIETRNATVRIREVGEYNLEVEPEGDRTIVRTRSGEAEVIGGSASHLVRANQEGVFSGLDELRAEIGPIAPRTAFESWAEDRARREDEAVSSRYVASEVTGYEDLDDYGDWRYESSYGYVWQPRYLRHDWAPYRFGRWVWISPWGWTWLDHARWGFAPFHYGRWVSLRNRWCWVPGPRHVRPVYAPALVGWTGNPPGGFTSVGAPVRWFPLAPHEVYVPGYKHTPRHARRVNQSNTVIDDARITRAYTARDRLRDYRHRTNPSAVTAGTPAMWEDLRERAAARRDATVSREAAPSREATPAPAPSRPQATYAPPAPSRPGSAAPAASRHSSSPPTTSGRSSSAPAPQASRREAGSTPARPSQSQPRDAGRPAYKQQ